MIQKSGPEKQPAEDAIKDIRRATRRYFSAEEKIRDGVRRLKRILDRCPEDGEQAVAQELVHYAIVRIDDIDQDLENGVDAGDNLGRRAPARCFCEVTNVNEHDADPPHFAELGRADGEQPLGHA
jgi:hypothetical protein